MLKIISSKSKRIYSHAPRFFFGLNNKFDYIDPNFSKLVIIGGGFSGMIATAHIPRLTSMGKYDIRLFDTQSFVTYTPSQDLLPFDIRTRDEIEKPILSVANDTSTLEFVEVESIIPEKDSLLTIENREYHYDYLVLANGLIPNYSKVKGLEEALKDRDCPVITTSSLSDIEKCKKEMELFYSGKILFYSDKKAKSYYSGLNVAMLFDEYLRKRKGGGLRSMSEFSYITNDSSVLPYVNYSIKLKNILLEKEINFDSSSFELVEIDKDSRKATFIDLNTQKKVEKDFDLLFVNPEFELPPFVRNLSTNEGYLNIDQSTFRHNQYANIFALGHCARGKNTVVTPKSIIEQSLTMTANIELSMKAATNHTIPDKYVRYSGETDIPLFTGNRKCLLAEIDPTRPDLMKEPSTMDFMKEVYVNPKIYFSLLTQGMWFGESKFKLPKFQVQ